MPDSYASATWTGSRRSGFSMWLRTGRVFAEPEPPSDTGVKFNPNHDPADGRFTTGGGSGGAGGSADTGGGVPARPKVSNLASTRSSGNTASAAVPPASGKSPMPEGQASRPPRPDHAGPTRMADLADLASPAEAPRTIRFSKTNTQVFETQRRLSFPGGISQEHGGAIVADRQGALGLQNIGGSGGSSEAFVHNLNLKNPESFSVAGSFHTHPYGRTEGQYTGVSFSGADVAVLINQRLTISVVQSGPRTFALVRTSQSPNAVDYNQLRVALKRETDQLEQQGRTFQQASRIVAERAASRYGLAYYQGSKGILTRVYPK